MTALVQAELRKTLTTRSNLLVAGFVVSYPALSVLPALLAAEAPAVDADTILQIVRGSARVLMLATLMVGIVAVAGEYRHGTIVPTLLASPGRTRLVVAKLGSQAALAVGLALAASAMALVVGTAYLSSRGVSVDVLSEQVLVTVLAATLVAAVYAVIGAAVGALVRSQTAAVAGALIWVFTIENAIPLVLRDPGLARWLPGGLADRLLHVADHLAGTGSAWAAVVTLAAVAGVVSAAAVVTTRAADVD